MAFKPTEEQAKIIDARNTSLLVSAAAGSGKTAVLVERIVSLVCDRNDPVDIDRILVVTFTQAAAAEMKERVLKRISEILEDDPENEHLLRQQTLVHRALITTTDSFCLDVIRNHFQDIGMEPDFRVVDDGEAGLMRADVLARVLEKAYEGGNPAFVKCVESFCPGNDDAILEDIVMGLYRNSESYPWPEEYLYERKSDHDAEKPEDLDGSGIEKAVLMSSYGYILYALHYIELAIRTCEKNPVMDNYAETFAQDREYFELLKNCALNGTLTQMFSFVGDLKDSKKRLKRLRKPENDEEAATAEELTGPAKKLRDAAWKNLERMRRNYYSFPIDEQVRMIAGCRDYVNAVIDLTIEFRREYAAEKKKRHSVDFSDLSHFALDILTEHEVKNGVVEIAATDAAKEYRDRFVQVMVDEYQDSNLIQEVILTAVSAESIGRYDRFTVGDVKQSIYSFRQARPDLFIEKQHEYSLIPPRMEIDLSGNFRSRVEVLSSVNRVFERIMHEENGGIEYDENAMLRAKAVYADNPGCMTELLIYDNKMMEEAALNMAADYNEGDAEGMDERADVSDMMEDASDRSELEARVIAARIRKLMTSRKVSDGNRDDPGLKEISYRDIVILCRSVSSVTETYRKVFSEMGIPLYAEGKNGYFKTAEVSLLLHYLRVLSNPLDDVPLYAVMHSVIGNFDENEITLIRAGRKKRPLYTSLLEASGRKEETDKNGRLLSSALKEKICAFLDRLDLFRDMSTYMTVRKLLDRITSDLHYMEICAALPGGQSRTGNVRMLLVMASNYERSSYLGLNDFIRYIDNMEKFEIDSGEVGSASESADVVRLMTIHKSKGLEFPVVFIAGMGRGFNFRDTYKPLLSDDALGLGCRFADTERRTRIRTLRYSAISDKKRRDVISEEMRLLYVAMTRAKEKLIMIGGMKNAEHDLDEYLAYPYQRLPFGLFQNSECYLDLILPVAGCEEVGEVIDVTLLGTDAITSPVKDDLESASEGVSEFAMAAAGDESLADPVSMRKLSERFSYVYPYGFLKQLYAKTTVSELKMAAMAEKDEGAYDLMEHGEDETPVPLFAGGSRNVRYDDPDVSAYGDGYPHAGAQKEVMHISGTERGNAVHRCMQLLNWDLILMPAFDMVPRSYEEYQALMSANKDKVKESIREFWKGERDCGHISEKTYVAVNPEKIYVFLMSRLSFRMWMAERAGLLKREQPFVFGVPASRLIHPDKEIISGALDDETVMIQGIIDAYFVENGRIILLDYKTDVVGSMEELWTRYETQMDYYMEALESLENMKVSERHLYSFKLGKDRDYGL
ncbi:MAG: helicase-exonuclease AddAB subunit AddA [Lachnospiraceae bacterium]|nr:helicase-exonuclease AddAB subunit AddA [Lachnospiraceae bacterium]